MVNNAENIGPPQMKQQGDIFLKVKHYIKNVGYKRKKNKKIKRMILIIISNLA